MRGSDRFSENIRGAFRAWARGDGRSVGAIRQAADEIRREREARYPKVDGITKYYGHWDPKQQKTHYYLNKNGEPTTEYPHIHVIHDERRGEAVGVIAWGPKDHSSRTVLNNPSGNEVNSLIASLLSQM